MSDDSEPIELFFSCRGLKDLDTTNKSDPKVNVYYKEKNTEFKKIGETEEVKNNLDPDFQNTVIMDFLFEKAQYLKLEVVDVDKDKEQIIGSVEITLNRIMNSKNLKLDLIEKGKKTGQIIVRGEKTKNNNDVILWKMNAKVKDLRGVLGGKCKPMVRISRQTEDGHKFKVYETEFKESLTPNYRQFEVRLQKLCLNKFEAPIILEVFDHHGDKEPSYMGKCITTVKHIMGNKQVPLQIQNETLKEDKKDVGQILIEVFEVKMSCTLINYIKAGLELNLQFAIDYTASNGPYESSDSLHFIDKDGQKFNQYQQVISDIGEIVIEYDHDHLVPVYGFGGKIQDISTDVLHCFNVNKNLHCADVKGVDGILNAYKNSQNFVKLSAPTYFGAVIQKLIQFTEEKQKNKVNQYSIMVIITDGTIHDFQETKNLLVQASHLPISLIIIGVGEDDFEMMDELDSDKQMLIDEQGNTAQRDLVQFVRYDVSSKSTIPLSELVLHELPGQVVQYFQSLGIDPTVLKDQLKKEDN